LSFLNAALVSEVLIVHHVALTSPPPHIGRLASHFLAATMIFLPEHKVGFDLNSIGFPSISGCHAIVVQVAGGLFGYHAYGGSTANAYSQRSPAFAGFVTGHASYGGGPVLGIYGAAFRKLRYSDEDVGWRQEISQYARDLRYTGKIRGLNLSDVVTEGNASGASAYVQFDLANGEITVRYKNWSKMQLAGQVAGVGAANYKQLTPKGDNTRVEDTAHGMSAAKIIVTASNKGSMHVAGRGRLDSFTPS
jgi:hypothetical protein